MRGRESTREKLVLGIETSCDDTSCAIYSSRRGILLHRTAVQLDHARFGGVVPEIASRSHLVTLPPLYDSVMERAGLELDDLAGIGVTNGPGLTGSLLVGLSFAKALSYGSGVPLVGIHHLEGHILANALGGEFDTPAVVLVVSGGHTQLFQVKHIGSYEFLGGTRDDAAGEAFDKIGKLLGLPFPGGPAVEQAARGGAPEAYDFPRALKSTGKCDFSFSGLKTAVRLKVEELGRLSERQIGDVAASAQEAIVDILVRKSLLAVKQAGCPSFYIAGGVAANGRLRERMRTEMEREQIAVSWPPVEYCTDNAAMIACAAYHHLRSGRSDGLDLNTFPRGELVSWNTSGP
ncbi:MAG: tRNA (adenosine(37)-N6)-threonylcarbamoyltransferase complex transferase subunit TsaD [Candidatus Krumholzibacteriota bacterium]|nr:tRNA (adenosine(37)-N6)-threonylcarbamoyltransferase complex transferase subunit TsaD [Candidatus Krumholzibacteriota bacterium]